MGASLAFCCPQTERVAHDQQAHQVGHGDLLREVFSAS